MDARLIDRIETTIERAASALFAGAVGFAAYEGLRDTLHQPQHAASAGSAGIIALLLCRRTLKAVGNRAPKFSGRLFDVRTVEWLDDQDELVLTDADRLDHRAELVLTDADRLGGGTELVLTNADRLDGGTELVLTDADRLDLHRDSGADEPLVLDDILTEIGAEARVVRLFDRNAMPTPGQLKSHIDNHLEQGQGPAASSDASRALSDALAELKRSLR